MDEELKKSISLSAQTIVQFHCSASPHSPSVLSSGHLKPFIASPFHPSPLPFTIKSPFRGWSGGWPNKRHPAVVILKLLHGKASDCRIAFRPPIVQFIISQLSCPIGTTTERRSERCTRSCVKLWSTARFLAQLVPALRQSSWLLPNDYCPAGRRNWKKTPRIRECERPRHRFYWFFNRLFARTN